MGRNEETNLTGLQALPWEPGAPAQVLPPTQGTWDSHLPSSEVPGYSSPHPQPRLQPIRSRENYRYVPGFLNLERKTPEVRKCPAPA